MAKLRVFYRVNLRGNYFVMLTQYPFNVFGIYVFAATNHHLVCSAPMKIISPRVTPHQIARALPTISAPLHRPSRAHPQGSNSLRVNFTQLTHHTTNRFTDGYLFIRFQILWRCQHKKACFRGAIEVIEYFAQLLVHGFNPFFIQSVAAANHTFHGLQVADNVFVLPHSGKHGGHNGQHFYRFLSDESECFGGVEPAHHTDFLTHQQRYNKRGQTETMIKRKRKKYTGIPIDTYIFQKREERRKKLGCRRFSAGFFINSACAAGQ